MIPDPGPTTAVVPPATDGERLDRFLALVTGCSRSDASAMVRVGSVTVDETVVTKAGTKLAAGQVVSFPAPGEPSANEVEPDETVRFDVVHADPAVVVVDKPAGLVVHPAPGHPDGTLCNGLLARYPEIAEVGEPSRPGIVHRLDRATSGLLVVARTPEAHADLVAQLAAHRVERVYTAVVVGRPESDHGVVDAPIGRSRRNPLRMTVAIGAKPARTHFEVRERFADPDCTLVRCRLETGRTHQIRVHMASVGHPVVGDDLYGAHRSALDAPRMFLHACVLGFTHPSSGEQQRFESGLPDDLAGWLAKRRSG